MKNAIWVLNAKLGIKNFFVLNKIQISNDMFSLQTSLKMLKLTQSGIYDLSIQRRIF